MDLSIIILSYNTRQLLKECLQSVFSSLQNSNLKFEIIVVDNASTDDSVAMVLKQFKAVKLIESKKNMGYSKANNLAARGTKGKYLLFLNSDIVVLNGAIDNLYRFIDQNIDASIAGGKLLNTGGKTPQPSCGPFYSLPVSFGVLFLRGDHWGLTRYSPDVVKKVDWVSGACLMLKKDIFNKIGGFDESIFMYMDEIDILYSASKKGYRTYFYPDAKFIHHGAASSKSNRAPVINIYKGLIYFYKKHHKGANLLILQLMLLLKGLLGIIVGMLLRNRDMQISYRQAMREAI